VYANLAIGPVIYGIPAQPLAIFQAAEYALDGLLTAIAGHDLFCAPIHAAGQQHGAPQTLIEQLRKSRGIEVKLQAPATVLLFEFGHKRSGQPTPNLALNLLLFPLRFGFISSMARRRCDCNTRLRLVVRLCSCSPAKKAEYFTTHRYSRRWTRIFSAAARRLGTAAGREFLGRSTAQLRRRLIPGQG
jgi:hypothetical protein